MIATTIAMHSGAKVVMLDRVDVLQPSSRAELIRWLSGLAKDGAIDTALLFGTFKELPTGLPENVRSVWIADGVVQAQVMEAA